MGGTARWVLGRKTFVLQPFLASPSHPVENQAGISEPCWSLAKHLIRMSLGKSVVNSRGVESRPCDSERAGPRGVN